MKDNRPVIGPADRFRRPLRVFVPILVAGFVHQACALLPAATPAAVPPPSMPVASSIPSAPPPTPTRPPPVSPTVDCDLDATLREVKVVVPYDQFAVHFNNISGTASLGVWYVDPELDPFPTADDLVQQLGEAKVRAAEVSARVGAASPCTSVLFDVINPIVVDTEYQGWLSGTIRPRDLPTGPDFTEAEIADAAERFSLGYARSALKHPSFQGTCEWPEARDRLQGHFSIDRENVAFYFVVDDLGAHVWVQWDGFPEPTLTVPNLGNIGLALECFRPDADVIYIIVDEDGVALEIGLMPQRDPARLTIVYP